MQQVNELLALFDREHLDGPTVAMNFMNRRVQPCKEQVHPLYEYTGLDEPTHETARHLTSDISDWWLGQLFELTGYEWIA